MSRHLLVMAIGPVQEFIASARRTRDLWFGSYLLSEISKSAARALVEYLQTPEGGGSTAEDALRALIFPAPNDVEQLKQGSSLTVSNVLVAALPSGVIPAVAARHVKRQVQLYWETLAHSVAKKVNAEQERVDSKRLESQLDDVIECYAAWVPLADEGAASTRERPTYAKARQRAMRLLAGRKQLRDFPVGVSEEGKPKSSLDGARDSVLLKNVGTSPMLRLSRGEQLDVVGLVKRAGELPGAKTTYPSVSRVAVDPWLRRLQAEAPEDFRQLQAIAAKLAARGIVSRVDLKTFQDFPFEGTVALPSRYFAMWEEAGALELPGEVDRANPAARNQKLLADPLYQELTRTIRSLHHKIGPPSPYLAALVADGDRVGEAISKLDSAEKNRGFSMLLSKFAEGVQRIFAEHHGVCVFAGGDDVFSFLPLDGCLTAARKLHDEFGRIWLDKGYERPPTLSVGVAIVHCHEHMEEMRAFGYEAERLAKSPDRDGLAVSVRSRSGAPVEIREQWKPAEVATSLDRRLATWTRLLNAKKLPNKLPYDLLSLARDYGSVPALDSGAAALRGDNVQVLTNWVDHQSDLLAAVQSDVRTLLGRKQTGGKLADNELQEIQSRLELFDTNAPSKSRANQVLKNLIELSQEILIAQQIASALRPVERTNPSETAALAGTVS